MHRFSLRVRSPSRWPTRCLCPTLSMSMTLSATVCWSPSRLTVCAGGPTASLPTLRRLSNGSRWAVTTPSASASPPFSIRSTSSIGSSRASCAPTPPTPSCPLPTAATFASHAASPTTPIPRDIAPRWTTTPRSRASSSVPTPSGATATASTHSPPTWPHFSATFSPLSGSSHSTATMCRFMLIRLRCWTPTPIIRMS